MQKCFFFISVAGLVTTIANIIFSDNDITELNGFIILVLKILLVGICGLGIAIHSIGFNTSRQ